MLHCFKLQCGLKAYNYLHGLIAAAFRRDLIGFCAVVAPVVVTRHVPRRFQRRHIHFVLFELLMLRNEPTCSSGGRGRSWGGRGRRGQMEGMLSGGTNRTLAISEEGILKQLLLFQFLFELPLLLSWSSRWRRRRRRRVWGRRWTTTTAAAARGAFCGATYAAGLR